MIEIFNKYELPIRQLYELINDILDYESFMNRCKSFSILDRSMSDSNYIRFQVNDEITFLVGVGTSKQNNRKKVISCAVLSICWWETYSEKDHETQEEIVSQPQLKVDYGSISLVYPTFLLCATISSSFDISSKYDFNIHSCL
jgi:hypothetical protein